MARIARLECASVLRRSRYHTATVAAESEKLLADPRIGEIAEQIGGTVRAEFGAQQVADELEKLRYGQLGKDKK